MIQIMIIVYRSEFAVFSKMLDRRISPNMPCFDNKIIIVSNEVKICVQTVFFALET